jgi:hypothetical protein
MELRTCASIKPRAVRHNQSFFFSLKSMESTDNELASDNEEEVEEPEPTGSANIHIVDNLQLCDSIVMKSNISRLEATATANHHQLRSSLVRSSFRAYQNRNNFFYVLLLLFSILLWTVPTNYRPKKSLWRHNPFCLLISSCPFGTYSHACRRRSGSNLLSRNWGTLFDC